MARIQVILWPGEQVILFSLIDCNLSLINSWVKQRSSLASKFSINWWCPIHWNIYIHTYYREQLIPGLASMVDTGFFCILYWGAQRIQSRTRWAPPTWLLARVATVSAPTEDTLFHFHPVLPLSTVLRSFLLGSGQTGAQNDRWED